MPAVTRVDPKTIFTPAEWERVSRQSVWKGPALVAFAWAVIIGAGALFIYAPNPATYLLAVMLIGARQLGLAILEHEAAHGTLHPNAKLNDWLAEWLCGGPVGGSLKRYRPYHLTHHKYTEQPEDPDLVLSRPFPTTRNSLARKFVRDLTGQTFYKQRIALFIAQLRGEKRKPPRVPDNPGARFWVAQAVIIVVTSALGYWWAWPVLWIVPMATWFPLVTRLRAMGEHAMVNTQEDPFTHARTTLANPIERLLIAPFWVHYHCEHHCFMYVPCYNLAKTHDLLMQKGFRERMRITRGYHEVLEAVRVEGRNGCEPGMTARARPARDVRTYGEETRELILTAAEKLFAAKGLHSVSMQDIAAEAGVSRATVFNQFGSKILVLDAITARSLENYRALLRAALADEKAPTADLLRRLFRQMGKGIVGNQNLYREVFVEIRKVSMGLDGEGVSPGLKRETFGILTEMFERGQERGDISRAASAEALATAFDSLLSGAVIQWLHANRRGSLPGMLESLVAVFLDGATA